MERNVRFAQRAFPTGKNLLKLKNHSAGIRFIDIIFDIDGTILDISHRVKFALQNPKDWKSFYSNMDADQPIEEICLCLNLYLKMTPIKSFFARVGLKITGKRPSTR